MADKNKVFMTVKTFEKISGAQNNWTTADVTLQPGHNNKICQTATNEPLDVSGQMKIQFTFNTADGSPDPAYVPVGIGFKSDSGGGDPVGASNFPQCSIENEITPGSTETQRAMTLTDEHKNSTSTWDFYIVLQRVSDAAIGIIDPKIRNV